MKVQEEIKPTGESRKIERQEPRNLRELDAAVAERVMGWVRRPSYNYWMTFPAGEAFQLHAYIATWWPSEKIETAMQVVDRFAKADWRIMLTSNPHAPQTMRWRVELFKELSPNNISVMELAETLPEAICLAALSAKAAEENTQTVVE